MRAWNDIHPKVAAAAVAFFAALALVWAAGLVGIDLREPVQTFIVGGLTVIAGYLKPE